MPSIPFSPPHFSALPLFSLTNISAFLPPQPGSPPPAHQFGLTGPMRSGSAPSTMKFWMSTVSSRELVSATEALDFSIWSAAFLLIGECSCPIFWHKATWNFMQEENNKIMLKKKLESRHLSLPMLYQ